MALSRDRSTSSQTVDQGFGMVRDEAGTILADLLVTATNQEHGIVARRARTTTPLADLPVGTRLRILHNHACATAAQRVRYHVLRSQDGALAEWARFGGW
jgi:D-serine deaminase-like pyridoxal phosphate-dependent protein